MPRAGVRVVCPRCGREGTLVVRRVRGYVEYYVRHRERDSVVEHGVTTLVDMLQESLAQEWGPPLSKPLRYYGGDGPLLPFLKRLVPRHVTYVEVFAGGATLLLSKPRSPVEVYNDLNSRLVNLYMCLGTAKCLEELVERLKSAPVSRVVWEEARRREKVAIPPESMPSAEEALYTLYARFWAHGGTLRSFNAADLWGGKTPHVQYWDMLPKKLKELHRRLRHVIFENADWRYILKKYDRETTFFYLDPPHHNIRGVEEYTGVPRWTGEDFLALLDTLKGVRGRWLLKYTWDHDVEKEIENRGFNYVVVEYFTSFKKAGGHYYIFAMNYAIDNVRPAGAVKRVVKMAMRSSGSQPI